jgi:hypothetical protein
MPTSAELLASLATIANAASDVAVAWDAVVAAALGRSRCCVRD